MITIFQKCINKILLQKLSDKLKICKLISFQFLISNFYKENIMIDPGMYIANEYEKIINYERYVISIAYFPLKRIKLIKGSPR